jgi:hypothetical protein
VAATIRRGSNGPRCSANSTASTRPTSNDLVTIL